MTKKIYILLTVKVDSDGCISYDMDKFNDAEQAHSEGRKRLDGRGKEIDGAAGIKLHIAYSVVKATYEYVTVTEGVGSEREQVLLEQFHNCLIIMDRG